MDVSFIVVLVLVVSLIVTGLYLAFTYGAHVLRPLLDKLDNIEAAALATTTVTIGPGDTLWHIARDRYPDMDPREAVYQIRQLNPGMNPGALQVGQAIIVPEVG
jgi:nucleoid-associated protein YgaU